MKITSIDIGKNNFALYIEKFDETMKIIAPVQARYNKDGTTTEIFEEYLTNIYMSGEGILLENLNISDKHMHNIYKNMIAVLEERDNFLKDCDIFLIEEQMAFRGKVNFTALKLAQHCYTYLMIKYPCAKIISVPAWKKTRILGMCKNDIKNKYKRKQWAWKEAIHIFSCRDENKYIEIIENSTKKDDLGDVVIQLQEYKTSIIK
mgnify:CR=1 FL=1